MHLEAIGALETILHNFSFEKEKNIVAYMWYNVVKKPRRNHCSCQKPPIFLIIRRFLTDPLVTH